MNLWYSQPPLYAHQSKTDTSLLRTVSFVPGQIKRLPVAEPDLQIKGEGRGGGHPDPEIRGTGSSHKKIFSTLPQFGLKIREGGLDPPLLTFSLDSTTHTA